MTLNKAQRNKITIAEDVIAQIKARKFNPTCGVYVGGGGGLLDNLTAGDDLQERVHNLKKGAACDVCALGSVFLSCVGLKGGYNVTDDEADAEFIDNDLMREKLEEFFEPEELGVIESTFEIDASFAYDQDSDLGDEFEDSIGFRSVLEKMEESERLLWIMQSVINLNGTITLEGFKQQLLLALAIDPKFAKYRDQLSF